MWPAIEKLGGWDWVGPLLRAPERNPPIKFASVAKWRNGARPMPWRIRFILTIEAKRLGVEIDPATDFIWQPKERSKPCNK